MNENVNIPCAAMEIADAEKLFFSSSIVKQAKAIAMCGECGIRISCLQVALDNQIEYGIFGGTTAKDRMVMINEINSCFTSAGTPQE